jgi:hypothetical protein
MTEFEDNVLQLMSAQYIQLCRIYDMLAIVADETKASDLRALHEIGQTLSPAPYLAEEDDEEEQ